MYIIKHFHPERPVSCKTTEVHCLDAKDVTHYLRQVASDAIHDNREFTFLPDVGASKQGIVFPNGETYHVIIKH